MLVVYAVEERALQDYFESIISIMTKSFLQHIRSKPIYAAYETWNFLVSRLYTYYN